MEAHRAAAQSTDGHAKVVTGLGRRHGKNGGIVLESKNAHGLLSDYLISENLAEVVDRIHGPNGVVANNISLLRDVAPASKSVAERETKNLP